MSLLVLAFPEFNKGDYKVIQNCRQFNDELYYPVVRPHFTLVFPVNDIEEDKFIEEVTLRCEGVLIIPFVLRCAIVNRDAIKNMYHTFLVPDKGFSRMVRLHDRLYSGLLSANLRLDIDYIPHIVVGNSTDPLTCKRLADEWNEKDFQFKGSIHSLSVARYENNHVDILHSIDLLGDDSY